MGPDTLRGRLAALLTILIWGTTFLSTKVLLAHFQPTEILFLRFLLGLGASALCFVTWGEAVRLLGAVPASLFLYLVPVITVAASVLLLGEPFSWQVGGGVALTLAGLLLSEGRLPRLRQGTETAP